jgi:hypothetical protein
MKTGAGRPVRRVFLVGEGVTDIGDLASASAYRRGREGFIQPVLRKLAPGLTLEIDGQKVSILPKLAQASRLPGHAERAARALAIAAAGGHEVLVFIKDVDRAPGCRASALERKKRIGAMHAEIEAGFARVRAANPQAATVRTLKGTPCRMLEAWALGDPQAIGKVGGKTARLGEVPVAPEACWGDEGDPDSNHPKCVLHRALGRRVSADDFAQIGHWAGIKSLRESCPGSFDPFAREAHAPGGPLS